MRAAVAAPSTSGGGGTPETVGRQAARRQRRRRRGRGCAWPPRQPATGRAFHSQMPRRLGRERIADDSLSRRAPRGRPSTRPVFSPRAPHTAAATAPRSLLGPPVDSGLPRGPALDVLLPLRQFLVVVAGSRRRRTVAKSVTTRPVVGVAGSSFRPTARRRRSTMKMDRNFPSSWSSKGSAFRSLKRHCLKLPFSGRKKWPPCRVIMPGSLPRHGFSSSSSRMRLQELKHRKHLVQNDKHLARMPLQNCYHRRKAS
ncbi:hypothetical protein V5799_009543 [Amblyomma americanum]|uniref:Uncharacterized protein n=1 Tax=Amblyomma americanum TaxID=6943 RepID=A0AAQ4FAG7_AMBAM